MDVECVSRCQPAWWIINGKPRVWMLPNKINTVNKKEKMSLHFTTEMKQTTPRWYRLTYMPALTRAAELHCNATRHPHAPENFNVPDEWDGINSGPISSPVFADHTWNVLVSGRLIGTTIFEIVPVLSERLCSCRTGCKVKPFKHFRTTTSVCFFAIVEHT